MITPHIEHLSPADAYMTGWSDREQAFVAEFDGLEDRLVSAHARQLDGLLERIYAISPGPTGRVVQVGFPVWEEEAIELANAWAA